MTGAGASLEFGMPSVGEIDMLFEDWAKTILPLKKDAKGSLYTWVKDKLDKYASQNPRNRIEAIVNFENVLYTIQNLASISSDDHWKHFNNRLKPFIDLKKFPEVLPFGKLEKFKVAVGNDFHFLQSYLIDELLNYFRAECKDQAKDKREKIKKLRNFFDSLKGEFEIGFVNLNYDNIITTTLPDLKTGFDKSGDFDRNELYSSSWNFRYHLHSSVHFTSICRAKIKLICIKFHGIVISTLSLPKFLWKKF